MLYMPFIESTNIEACYFIKGAVTMKRFRKTILTLLSVLLITSSFLFVSNSVKAAENNEIKSISEYQEKLLAFVKLKKPQTEDQLNVTIDEFNNLNKFSQQALNDYYIDSNSKTILPNVENPKSDLDIEEYIDSNIDQGKFSEYNINDDLTITLTDTPVYFIESTTEEDTPEDPIDFETAAAKYKNTKTYKHSYTAKNFLNMKLFTVNAKGYFQYNGSDVKPKLNDAWYTRGVLSIWQVSNWKAGTYKKGSNYAEVYGRGNFHFGLEIAGYGLVVQDQYIKVYLTGNKKGSVWKHHSIK